ncbi:MAG: hypothetical protein KDI37_05120, partial [Xanthomonadales bacterium]|nr:hypothetical protein [Xanthomonadales bacterium]
APVHAWQRGEVSLFEAVFSNHSGPLGRPLSMLSFILSEIMGGGDPYAYKLGNLLLHLLNTAIVFLLTRRLLARVSDASHRQLLWTGITVALFWAVHPIQVSTVAYAIQRMAQISTLFTLLALFAFAVGSATTHTGNRRLLVFVLLPLLTVLAALGKENGLLVPAYCLALHVGWLGGNSTLSTRETRVFFGAFLALPAMAMLLVLLTAPDTLIGGYRLRDFTLAERLLTEPRVLLDYLGSYLAPQLVTATVHMDDVVASTSLLSPASTAFALLFWGLLLLAGWTQRRARPALLGSTLFFLAGHAMESTLFPLELAFEHRNYLASLAIPLLVATILLRSGRLSRLLARHRPTATMLLAAGFLLVAGLTFLRADEWSNRERLVQSAYSKRPDSMRARLDYAQLAIENGRFDLADPIFAEMEQSKNARERFVGQSYATLSQCLAGQPVDPNWADRFANSAPTPLTLTELAIAKAFSDTSSAGLCTTIPVDELAVAFAAVADSGQAHQPRTDTPVWQIRLLAAQSFERAGQRELAIRQARRSWEASQGFAPTGIMLTRLLLAQGEKAKAWEVLDRLEEETAKGQYLLQQEIARLHQDG